MTDASRLVDRAAQVWGLSVDDYPLPDHAVRRGLKGLAFAGLLVTPEAEAIVTAAIDWRRYVTIAEPVGHRPPPRSTVLARAVDAYLAAQRRDIA